MSLNRINAYIETIKPIKRDLNDIVQSLRLKMECYLTDSQNHYRTRKMTEEQKLLMEAFFGPCRIKEDNERWFDVFDLYRRGNMLLLNYRIENFSKSLRTQTHRKLNALVKIGFLKKKLVPRSLFLPKYVKHFGGRETVYCLTQEGRMCLHLSFLERRVICRVSIEDKLLNIQKLIQILISEGFLQTI